MRSTQITTREIPGIPSAPRRRRPGNDRSLRLSSIMFSLLLCFGQSIPGQSHSSPPLRAPLTHDGVSKHADALDFQFDHVAIIEEPADLEAAAIADSARAKKLPGMNRLVLGRIGKDFLE